MTTTTTTTTTAKIETLSCKTFLRRECGKYFYPFGNTSPEDLFLRCHDDPTSSTTTNNSQKEDVVLSGLFLGCGDLRSLLFTIQEAQRKQTACQFSFVLNDWQPEVIARNVLFLHALTTTTSTSFQKIIKPMWLLQIWYSLTMDRDVHEFWMDQIRACLAMDWDNQESFITLLDEESIHMVKWVWQSWLECDWTTEQLFQRRQAFLSIPPHNRILQQQPEYYALHVQMRAFLSNPSSEHCKKRTKEYMDFFVTGTFTSSSSSSSTSTSTNSNSNGKDTHDNNNHNNITTTNNNNTTTGPLPNPTMLLVNPDGTFTYALHYGTNAYDGIHWDTKKSLKANLLEHVTGWMHSLYALQSQIRSISFSATHALTFLERTVAAMNSAAAANHHGTTNQTTTATSSSSSSSSCLLLFDAIETSNLADHLGLLNLLVGCSPLLRTPGQSILKICTFHQYQFTKSRDEYFNKVIGIDKKALATLIGVELLQEPTGTDHWLSANQPFMHGPSSVMKGTVQRSPEFYLFTKACRPTIPISLHDSPYLMDSLVNCAKLVCCSVYEKDDFPGGCDGNPKVLAKLLGYAFADQRLANNTASLSGDTDTAATATAVVANRNNVFPFTFPIKLYNAIQSFKSLQVSASDFYTNCYWYGFDMGPLIMANDGDFSVYHMTHEFPLVDESTNPGATPILLLFFQLGPSYSHTVESLQVEMIPHRPNVIRISALIPNHFVRLFSKENITVTLYTKNHSQNHAFPQLIPASEPIPLTSVHLTDVPLSMMDAIQAIMNHVPPPVDLVLPIEYIQEKEHGFTLKLLFTESTKEAKVEVDDVLPLLKINGKKFLLDVVSTQAKIGKVKIHRKNGFVLVNLVKVTRMTPLVHLSIHQLKPCHDYNPEGPELGMMFDAEDRMMRRNGGKCSDPLRQVVYDLKQTIQSFFYFSKDGMELFCLMLNNTACRGLVLSHGVYKMPPVDHDHSETLLLDASAFVLADYKKASSRDAKFMRSITMRYSHKMGHINVDANELKVLQRYFEVLHSQTANKEAHDSVKQMGATHLFKRCIIYPLYPLSVNHVMEIKNTTTNKKKDEMNARREEFKGMMKALWEAN